MRLHIQFFFRSSLDLFLFNVPKSINRLFYFLQASSITNSNDGKNRIIKMTDLIKNGGTTSPQEVERNKILYKSSIFVNKNPNSSVFKLNSFNDTGTPDALVIT